jgi:glycosyltransferase involved in cell wall biosynthesis
MKQHKFTIIIPTRERADTLYWALKTCVAQDYENLEILVSDNLSQDNTKEVVDAFQDKRIKYINTGNRVEMSLNWEFALKHVKEGYVCFLGDDDGFTINSISFINQILNAVPTLAIVWKEAAYGWPSLTNQYKDHLSISAFDYLVTLKDAKYELNQFLKNKISYKELVSIYPNGFVDVDVIKKQIAKQGNFFVCTSPDLYSAMMLANLVETYVYVDMPLSMSGGSAKSNSGTDDNVLKVFINENKVTAIHTLLGGAYFPSWSFLLADSMFYVKDSLGELPKRFVTETVLKVIEQTIKEYIFINPDKYAKLAPKMLELAALHNIDESYVNKLLKKYPNKFVIDNVSRESSYSGWHNNALVIQASKININNIYEVSLFVAEITKLDFKKLKLIKQNQIIKFAFRCNTLVKKAILRYLCKPLN